MTTFFDTSVLIKILDHNAELHEWCVAQLEARKAIGPAIISDIVYCEWSIGMETQDHVNEAVATLALQRLRGSNTALFRAGRAFKKYREDNAGPKLGVMPDFIIGAIAETEGAPLVTTNPRDFVRYFPNLVLIQPG